MESNFSADFKLPEWQPASLEDTTGGGNGRERQYGTLLPTPPAARRAQRISSAFEFFADNFTPQEAVTQFSLPDLKDALFNFSELLSHENAGLKPQASDPEQWAQLYYSSVGGDVVAFFDQVASSSLARCSPMGKSLALCAAAYAWVSLQQNPDYAPPGSLMEEFRHMSPAQQRAYLDAAAAFEKQSCLIEDIHVNEEEVRQAFQHALS